MFHQEYTYFHSNQSLKNLAVLFLVRVGIHLLRVPHHFDHLSVFDSVHRAHRTWLQAFVDGLSFGYFLQCLLLALLVVSALLVHSFDWVGGLLLLKLAEGHNLVGAWLGWGSWL